MNMRYSKIGKAAIMVTVLLSLTACGKSWKFEGRTLTEGKVGEAYADAVAAKDKEDLYYELDYDAVLPAGLELAENGSISGTPTEAGTVEFKVIASDDEDYKEADFTITVAKGTLTYEAMELEKGKVGEPYLQNVAGAAGAEEIVYSLKEGSSLPAGLELSESGDITGTPETAGTVSFVIVAAASGCDPVEAEYTVIIEEGREEAQDLGKIVFEGFKLPDAEVGTAYNESIRNAYGVPDITYQVKYINGISLPKGLVVDETGFIHGTPEGSTSGEMKFQVIASAEGYDPVSVECSLQVYDKYEETTTFEAEYVDVSKLQGAGYSSSPSGKGMLQQFQNASNGYTLGYLHKAIKVDFYFESDAATTGKLILGLGTEVGPITFTKDSFKIYVNDTEIDYGSIDVQEKGTGQSTEFQEFALNPEIQILKGQNKLTFEVLNQTENKGIGTSTAKGPIFDYVKIDGADAKIGWRPVVSNIN